MIKEKLSSRIIFIGGHLTPAIAVLTELKKRGYRNIVWIGTKHTQSSDRSLSAEFQTVTSLNIKFYNLKTGKIIRKWNRSTFLNGIKNMILIPFGIIQAFFLILFLRPKLIVSFGGYLSVFPVLWGRIFGSKIITHEQTLVSGLANKVIARFAHKILVSWEESKDFFNPKKTILTGNPIRREIFISKSNTLTNEFDKRKPVLLIFCGNQGSHTVNTLIFEILEDLLEICNVIHQTGSSTVTGDFKKAQETKRLLPYSKKSLYSVRDYILNQEIGEAMQKADLILGRSGANNITEILALGKLSILIPIPWTSGNEQMLNAKLVENTGLGLVLEQNQNLLSNKILEKIKFGLENLKHNRGFNTKTLDECKNKALDLINLSAHSDICDIIEKGLD